MNIFPNCILLYSTFYLNNSYLGTLKLFPIFSLYAALIQLKNVYLLYKSIKPKNVNFLIFGYILPTFYLESMYQLVLTTAK